jgi:predicted metalloprotease with PDZ domain/uncharacterized membrane protein
MPANAALLHDIPLFQPMDDNERSAIAALMDEASFAAGQQLFHERDQGGVCYVVRSGRVELSVTDENGEKLVVDVLEPGELCGELSLLDGGNRSTTAVALTSLEVLVLQRAPLIGYLRKQPDAALDLLAALSRRIRRADALIRQRVQDPNEVIEAKATLGERVADAVASFGGSWRFIFMFLLGMAIWVGVNVVTGARFDPYPFILLNLILSMLAALQAPVIMMSQNRQDAKDRIRSEADFRVNVKAEVEIAELHEKLDRLRGELKLDMAKLTSQIGKAAGAALVIAALFVGGPARAAEPSAPRITLAVDAADAARRVLHVRESVPAAPGPLTLQYPKWIPGTHAPDGRITEVVSLAFSAGGHPLAWQRDAEDLYAFHLVVPPGARSVDVAFDFLAPVQQGPESPGDTSARLAMFEWYRVVLYPKGADPRTLTVAPSLKLPAGWKFGTALETQRAGAAVEFKPVTLETLADSPVLAGEYFRAVPLAAGVTPPHVLDLAADSAHALEAPADTERAWSRLVTEAGALFGARHYLRYHFLWALSDLVGRSGLEHHQSSDNRGQERTLIDDDLRALAAGLLPHEFVHSWNGKYRRPAGLATPDFQAPMRGDLLWVYEGLTTYLGMVLDGRSGLSSAEWMRENFALSAAMLDHRPGRSWRPLVDTAVSAQILYRAGGGFVSLRRSVDYYPESALLWLEADTIIRQRSGGARSLDDFCRRFYGGASGPPEVKTYERDDVIAALDAVEPFDWRGFFAARVDAVTAHPPLAGLTAGGWRLVYTSKPNLVAQAADKANKQSNFVYSIGLLVKEDGHVIDAVPGMAAAQAGVGPGMRLVAVNGRRYSTKLMRDAVAATAQGGPLELLVENGDFFQPARLLYKGGERWPHLERDAARPDLLGEILRPLSRGL